MLEPLGLPADVNVIAWGLSLERPTMIQYNVIVGIFLIFRLMILELLLDTKLKLRLSERILSAVSLD